MAPRWSDFVPPVMRGQASEAFGEKSNSDLFALEWAGTLLERMENNPERSFRPEKRSYGLRMKVLETDGKPVGLEITGISPLMTEPSFRLLVALAGNMARRIQYERRLPPDYYKVTVETRRTRRAITIRKELRG